MSLRAHLASQLLAACRRLAARGELRHAPDSAAVTTPSRPGHGDYASPLPLKLATAEKRPPRPLAELIAAELGDAGGLAAGIEVAGPGYLNITVAPHRWRQVVLDVLRQGADFVRSQPPQPLAILVEHVSANPTGPLHVAHGRGAVMGDVVANLLAAAGHRVEREYYVNDTGGQIDVLARSVWARYRHLCGLPLEIPADFYPGAYVGDLADRIFAEVGDGWVNDQDGALPRIAKRSTERMLAGIQEDLARFGVRFDRFVSERDNLAAHDLAGLLRTIERAGHSYREGGKLWLRTTAFGDDKDRVMVREDGRPTYFAGDIAYHHDKASRGFDRLVNVWGADHGGYVARVRAGMRALGDDPDRLVVLLLQMVSVTQGGEAMRMGKRLGTAVWLREIVDEVGADAFRYLFVARRGDAQMDFDVDLARRRSLDNPVFYAQMGHARLAAIARRAAAAGLEPPPLTAALLESLALPDEMALVRALARAPEVVQAAAAAYEPHQVAAYLQELIAQFHSYYTRHRADAPVVGPPGPETWARLGLCAALKTTLAALLGILGVSAPEHMAAPQGAAEAV